MKRRTLRGILHRYFLYLLVLSVGAIVLVRQLDLTFLWGHVEKTMGPGWFSSYEEAKAKAVEKQQVLMVYFGANWCLPCQDLENSTFVDEQVAVLMKSFVAVKIDATRMTDELNRLFKRYRVYSLPTILFIDPNGKVSQSHRIVGYIEPEALTRLLRDFPSVNAEGSE